MIFRATMSQIGSFRSTKLSLRRVRSKAFKRICCCSAVPAPAVGSQKSYFLFLGTGNRASRPTRRISHPRCVRRTGTDTASRSVLFLGRATGEQGAGTLRIPDSGAACPASVVAGATRLPSRSLALPMQGNKAQQLRQSALVPTRREWVASGDAMTGAPCRPLPMALDHLQRP